MVPVRWHGRSKNTRSRTSFPTTSKNPTFFTSGEVAAKSKVVATRLKRVSTGWITQPNFTPSAVIRVACSPTSCKRLKSIERMIGVHRDATEGRLRITKYRPWNRTQSRRALYQILDWNLLKVGIDQPNRQNQRTSTQISNRLRRAAPGDYKRESERKYGR